MPLVNFRKKFRFFSFDFAPEFRSSNISVVTEHTQNQLFLMSYPKKFFSKILTLVLLDGFLDGFRKFRLFIVKICISIGILSIFRKL
jgi:hypothetical protein